ncbi:hypothetical protein GCM10020006_12990 [Fructilactobacillus sanfranciscensis]
MNMLQNKCGLILLIFMKNCLKNICDKINNKIYIKKSEINEHLSVWRAKFVSLEKQDVKIEVF